MKGKTTLMYLCLFACAIANTHTEYFIFNHSLTGATGISSTTNQHAMNIHVFYITVSIV